LTDQHIDLYHVTHIDVVPQLLSISKYLGPLSLKDLSGKDGDYPCLSAGVLARSVDVSIAQTDAV